MKLRLKLLNGRTKPLDIDTNMEGPVFDFNSVRMIYSSHIEIDGELWSKREDMLYYDGVYYSDAVIYSPDDSEEELTVFDIEKTTPVKTVWMITEMQHGSAQYPEGIFTTRQKAIEHCNDYFNEPITIEQSNWKEIYICERPQAEQTADADELRDNINGYMIEEITLDQ